MQPKSKILIGVFKSPSHDGDMKTAQTVGYRIFDLKTGEINDFNIAKRGEIGKFKDYFRENKGNIQNLIPAPKGSSSYVKFINGAENRYPVIDPNTGELIGKNRLIIYGAYEDGFGVIDYAGRRDEWSKDQAVAYAQINGVANGKVVSKNGGQPYLAAISSEYPEIKRKIRHVPEGEYTDALDTSEPKVNVPEMKTISGKDIEIAKPTKPIKPVDTKPIKTVDTKPIKPEETKGAKEAKTTEEVKLIPRKPVDEHKVAVAKAEDKRDVKEGEKEVPKKPKQKYTDNFYRQLEADFGGHNSVLLLKYIVEIRDGGSLDKFIALSNRPNTDSKIIPSLAGLILRGMDDVEDKALLTLMKRVIDPSAIELSDSLKENGLRLDEVYDSGEIFSNRKYTDSKYLFKREMLEGRLANYLRKTKGRLYNLDYSSGNPYYNGNLIDVDGYKLSGLDIDKITITSTDGATTKSIRIK